MLNIKYKKIYNKLFKLIRLELLDEEGFLHSYNDKPSKICYDSNNNIAYKEWNKHGFVHRLNGPSCIWYDENEKVFCESFYIDNTRCSEKEFNIQRNLRLLQKD